MSEGTDDPRPASVGLLFDTSRAEEEWGAGRDVWFGYVREVLGHLAVAFDELGVDDVAPPSHRLLVVPSVPALSAEQVETLTRWVHEGGGLVLCGDPGPLAELAGSTSAGVVSDGHVLVGAAEAWGSPPDVALHAFGGVRLAGPATALATWTDNGAPAITTRQVGRGRVTVFGADLWQSIVRIHQGWPVSADGTPAADGSAPVDDGILKCDDGLALSYEHDRAMAPAAGEFVEPFEYVTPIGAPAPTFHRPHGDLWRGLFAAVLFWTAEGAGQPVGWLSYWPYDVPAVAHMSHDSDGNTDESARAALSVFAEADVSVTWCLLHPGGYSDQIFRDIVAAGHESALHYNAMAESDIAVWGEEYFVQQLEWARTKSGERIVSNKNHYTRWEGWHEFYLWCEREGIELDQTRGPSKQGNTGFSFGSCHLTFPMADHTERNRPIDVLSMPMLAQDLWLTCAEGNRSEFLEQTLAQHGVAHFLFHGWNINRWGEVRQAVLDTAAAARKLGMPWWTAAEVNAWERGRRQVRVAAELVDGGVSVTVDSARAVPNASVLVAVPGLDSSAAVKVSSDGRARVAQRHGRSFVELGVDLPAGRSSWQLAMD